MKVSIISAVLATAGVSNAFWRMPCRSRTGLARMDPLVDFGSISDHAHAIHGGSGFSTTADTAALLGSDCTSCEVAEDKSAYWTPALYFKSASTGEFTLVDQVGGMLAYYLLYPNVGNTTVSAFPTGFEMIAGDTFQRNFTWPVPDKPKSSWTGDLQSQEFLRQAALGFNCLNYAIAPEGSLYRHFLPDKAYLDANCKDGVRFELMFPSCWDGKNLDGINHDKKSHVAYPSEVMTGNCPSGFETRLVSMFFETIWNTYEFVGQDGEFVIANGDTTGYGYHGDFMMGWDEAFLQSAVNQCTNPSGQVSDCPLFTLQDSSVFSSCKITDMPSSLLKENVLEKLSELPGGMPIVSGPGYAKGADMAHDSGSGIGSFISSLIPSAAQPTPASSPSNVAPTLSHSDGSTIAPTDTYAPGAVFVAASEGAASGSAAPVVEAAAVTSAPPAPPVPTQSFFSTQITTSGQDVMEIYWVEQVVTVTASETATVTVPAGRKRHLHKHRRGSDML